MARPWPFPLEMVATVGSDEVHWTASVMLLCVESEKVPATLNCRGTPTGSLLRAGVIVSAVSVAGATVSQAVPFTEPAVAVTMAVPTLMGRASPLDPAALDTIKSADFEEVQVTSAVTSRVVLLFRNV